MNVATILKQKGGGVFTTTSEKSLLDIAKLLAGGVKVPAVLHAAERTAQVLDENLQVRAIERDASDESLADHLVGDRHLGDDGFNPLPCRTVLAYPHVLAERHELRVMLHVGDKIEHVGSGMTHAPLGPELRHQAREARAALRRAKSSPA